MLRRLARALRPGATDGQKIARRCPASRRERRPSLGATGLHESIDLRALDETYAVLKAWGEERWLMPERSPFAMKVIRLKEGFRTSLQVHVAKEEMNLIVAGRGLLHHEHPMTGELMTSPLAPGSVIHIRPGAVHRIAATTDMTMVEASTPHLDDVVRLEDDWGRPSGKIDAEHSPIPPRQ